MNDIQERAQSAYEVLEKKYKDQIRNLTFADQQAVERGEVGDSPVMQLARSLYLEMLSCKGEALEQGVSVGTRSSIMHISG